MFLPMLGPKAMLEVSERRPGASTNVAPVAGSILAVVPPVGMHRQPMRVGRPCAQPDSVAAS